LGLLSFKVTVMDRTLGYSQPKGLAALGTCVLGIAIASASVAQTNNGPTAHVTFKSGKAYYHAIHVDMSRTDIAATTHYSSRLRSFSSTAQEVQPIAAITGTFFAWENQQPVADVIVNGQKEATGYRGSVLAVDWFGKVSIFDAPVKKPVDYFPYRHALRGMVRVLRDGKVCPDPRSQGFRDARIWGSAARTGVGLTAKGKLVMVATANSVTLSQLAAALKSRGAVDAVSLDGGGSTMLYYRGKYKISTSRPLSTVFMIEKKNVYDELYTKHMQRIGWNQSSGALQGVLQDLNARGK
jgi:hypothetical protein